MFLLFSDDFRHVSSSLSEPGQSYLRIWDFAAVAWEIFEQSVLPLGILA